MKIICLFVQRINSYPGEYAPELFNAVDEYTDDDNPDVLIDSENNIKKDDSIEYYKRIIIEVGDKQFDTIFKQKKLIVKGVTKSD
jgi:hypothetical protein